MGAGVRRDGGVRSGVGGGEGEVGAQEDGAAGGKGKEEQEMTRKEIFALQKSKELMSLLPFRPYLCFKQSIPVVFFVSNVPCICPSVRTFAKSIHY